MIKYLLEIKNRFFLLIFTWLSSVFTCYFYKETLLFLITQPHKSFMSYFIFTNVTEVFSVYIQLINFLCFQIFLIYFTYHIFNFLSSALFETELCYLRFFFKIALLNWACSIFLNNFFIVPLTWNFFLSFQDLTSAKFIQLHFESKLTEYLTFYILMYYLVVCYCQIFTILFFFLNFSNNNIKVIKKFRKVFYYFFIIFSTLISPPDVFSQVLISFIAILVYELIVFCITVNTKLVLTW